jgi:hypothetical protein
MRLASYSRARLEDLYIQVCYMMLTNALWVELTILYMYTSRQGHGCPHPSLALGERIHGEVLIDIGRVERVASQLGR